MNWKVDDIAIVRNTVHPKWSMYVGTACKIIAVDIASEWPDMQYLVLLVDGIEVGAGDIHLRRRDDDNDDARYDGKDKCKWPDDCEWRPKEPVTIPVTEPEEPEIA